MSAKVDREAAASHAWPHAAVIEAKRIATELDRISARTCDLIERSRQLLDETAPLVGRRSAGD